jgi:hypothetical protein
MTYEEMPQEIWRITSSCVVYRLVKLCVHPVHSRYTIYMSHLSQEPVRVYNEGPFHTTRRAALEKALKLSESRVSRLKKGLRAEGVTDGTDTDPIPSVEGQ